MSESFFKAYFICIFFIFLSNLVLYQSTTRFMLHSSTGKWIHVFVCDIVDPPQSGLDSANQRLDLHRSAQCTRNDYPWNLSHPQTAQDETNDECIVLFRLGPLRKMKNEKLVISLMWSFYLSVSAPILLPVRMSKDYHTALKETTFYMLEKPWHLTSGTEIYIYTFSGCYFFIYIHITSPWRS